MGSNEFRTLPKSDGTIMRIFIINNVPLRNHGDVLMLQVTASRLKTLWPDARVDVATESPDLLARYCPDVHPVLERIGHRIFVADRKLFPWRLYSGLPIILSNFLQKLEDIMRCRLPLMSRTFLHLRYRGTEEVAKLDEFLESFLGSDAIVFSGGGFITDAWKGYALTNLKTLEVAIRLGKPTAMFGQGIGPVENPELLAKLRKVLPSVDLVAIRENRSGLSLLKSSGVSLNRVVTTGDDAIELAYKDYAAELGDAIGVNLRVTWYSEATSMHVKAIRSALDRTARKLDAPLLPVPISLHDNEDIRSINEVLGDNGGLSNRGSFSNIRDFDSPRKVIAQIKHCRVVVTGSYHGGVLALSQGIPVVGLASSRYYVDKFFGLADQFGIGCDVVLLNKERLCDTLSEKIEAAWKSAHQVRPRLLDAAVRQIKSSRDAYNRFYEIVTNRT